MDTSRADELILLSLTGEISREESLELQLWASGSEQARSYYEGIRDLWMAAGAASGLEKFDAEKAFESFKQTYLSRQSAQERSYTARLPRFSWVWRAAAALVLLAGVGAAGWWSGRENVRNAFSDIEVEAPVASSTRLTLPDGTLVHLNAASRIRYSQGFGVSNREIRLSGEACFDVVRNDRIPFVVSSDNLLVRVVGTQFNFRDYPEDLEAVVSLKRGRVILSNLLIDEGEKFLYPDQRMVLDKHNARMRIESKDASKSMLWTDGILFFDEALLSDIAKDLERRYNVHITILGEQLRQMRIYGSFSSQDVGIREIMEVFARTNHLSYAIEDKQIILQ